MKFPGKLKMKMSESILISLFSLMSMFAFDRFWQKPHSKELRELQAKVVDAKKKIDDTQKLLDGLKNRAPAVATADHHTASSLFDRYLTSNERF